MSAVSSSLSLRSSRAMDLDGLAYTYPSTCSALNVEEDMTLGSAVDDVIGAGKLTAQRIRRRFRGSGP